jgi:uncharacterized protein YndB with AHSA1/START domain
MRCEEGHYSSVTDVREVDQGADRLVLQVELTKLSPEQVFDHFARPELLTRWWPTEAENDPRPGGWYHFAWPAQDWHLRGRYTAFEPGRSLGFTWQWDHEPERPMRHVAVDFAGHAHGGGCVVTVTHALYGDDPTEQEDRESHREGWLHFLARLDSLTNVG